MELHSWFLFTSIAFIATVTPGPAVLLVTSHSVSHGWRQALFTALGNITGLFIMSALSVAGLSAIILGSVIIFNCVKFLGAFYLIYLGLRLWRNGFGKTPPAQSVGARRTSKSKLYFQGLTVALSNPKAIAFTTALFPQFINRHVPLGGQFTVLIATFMLLSFGCLVCYGYAAERTKKSLFSASPRFLHKVFGAGFIGAGVMLACSTHKHTRHLSP